MTLAIPFARLTIMLELQNNLNERVNPKWLEAHYPWHRAAWIEAAELADSIGWKWWKKQEPDRNNVKIELVDLWHFALSYALQVTRGDLNEAADFIVQQCSWMSEVSDPLAEIDKFIGDCSFGGVPAPRILALCHHYGMTEDALYNAYVAKNLLNLFRQDNGYKAGTYIKTWGLRGGEDNEFVSHLLLTMPDATPAVLLGEMTDHYVKVLARQPQQEAANVS
jgi:dimeric dUTPase (all-alpha-NTP-PPase superfamily)